MRRVDIMEMSMGVYVGESGTPSPAPVGSPFFGFQMSSS